MDSPSKQFGFIVAYLLPGFIGLAGLVPFVPLFGAWLHPVSYSEASLGPPIYALLAATTMGMIANALRRLLIDHIHAWTGIVPPVWDDSRLEERLGAFNYLVENHYRYYQFVANTLIAVIWTYLINRFLGTSPFLGWGSDIGVIILCVALFVTSRDTLQKYYTRTGRLVGVEKGSHVRSDAQRKRPQGRARRDEVAATVEAGE